MSRVRALADHSRFSHKLSRHPESQYVSISELAALKIRSKTAGLDRFDSDVPPSLGQPHHVSTRSSEGPQDAFDLEGTFLPRSISYYALSSMNPSSSGDNRMYGSSVIAEANPNPTTLRYTLAARRRPPPPQTAPPPSLALQSLIISLGRHDPPKSHRIR